MKRLILLFMLFFNFMIFSQSSDINLFAQCKFEIKDQKKLKELEEKIKNNPNVKIVRLDFVSQRSFIITKNISNLTEEQFLSWFENYSDLVSCIQIGIYGVDKINPFPFTNCSNK